MKLFLHNYIFLLNLLYCNCVVYIKESHIHNKWLFVNVTCPEEGASNPNAVHEKHVKRSMSYDAFRNDIALNELHDLNDYSNVTGYDSESPVSKPKKSKKENDGPVPEIDAYVASSNSSEILSGNSSLVQSEDTVITETGHAIPKASVTINCDSLEIDSNITDSSIKHLRIRSYGKLIITSEWANELNDLQVLNIHSENGLTLPSEKNCSWVPYSLTTLDLSQTTLKKFALSDCPPTLKELQVQGTSLESLSLCVEYLEELDAAWNLLGGDGITRDCEDGTSNVKILKLHNNELSHWTSCGWPSLTSLELQKNELKSVNLSSCVLHNLLEINLSYNKLKEAPHKYPPKIVSINLSHNHIEKTTHFHRTVQEVDISHNYIANISKGTFRSASQLLSLDLSYNQLTIIYGHDFGGLHALRYLDLSHNAISHIRHEAFDPLRYILSLNIDNNKLHQLDSRLLANLPSNFQFRIHGNPWRCGCHLLSALSRASKYLCKPHCHQQPELTCRERNAEVPAQNVLRQCLAAVQDNDTSSFPFHVLPDKRNSDEDTSEEKKETTFSYYIIIPIVALFLGVPLIAFAVRTIYLNRKNMKRCCNCLANSPNVRWTEHRNVERESDSETEF